MSTDLETRALRALARREHSRAELARKLTAHATAEEIATLLDRLEQSGLLSDTRYAEGYVAARAARFGAAKLRHSLRASGVAEDVIEAAVSADREAETARARELWRRKFGVLPQERNEYARQARFLQGRGFSADVIRQVLKDIEQ